MSAKTGWKARAIALFADAGGPWGNRGGGGQNGGGSGGSGPRNPWSAPPGGGGGGPRGPSGFDALLRRLTGRFGGDGDGGPPWRLIRLGGGAVIGLWVLLTSFHSIAPQERGIVTTFGAYSRTLESGIGLTLPSPIERVTKLNVAEIRTIDIPAGNGVENFVLTGDQNIIDLDYSVRWSIADPELFRFQLKDPEETIREVAESAMRAAVSRVDLTGAIGAKRGQIEADVENRMRAILGSYRSGIRIEGVAIKRADPPAAVMDAFKDVTAAQQEAQSMINQANTYSQQVTQRALGEAQAFDKVYVQYKLSPVVTRRRMYYDTMEQVLGKLDKTIIETPNVMPYVAVPPAARKATEPDATVTAQPGAR
ncbi:MAG: FtsH protease activity modulator HflK [Chakrabartia sp.]